MGATNKRSISASSGSISAARRSHRAESAGSGVSWGVGTGATACQAIFLSKGGNVGHTQFGVGGDKHWGEPRQQTLAGATCSTTAAKRVPHAVASRFRRSQAIPHSSARAVIRPYSIRGWWRQALGRATATEGRPAQPPGKARPACRRDSLLRIPPNVPVRRRFGWPESSQRRWLAPDGIVFSSFRLPLSVSNGGRNVTPAMAVKNAAAEIPTRGKRCMITLCDACASGVARTIERYKKRGLYT